ncbi:primosomal protein N' [Sneathiella chinensis]|uniref:Replication restart protein PriA n=2 Tax=Sneathiella chinensis TaxID=349750 RepID=A0ABQ5U6S8_9PROT|nr:primosomal protein N' [Sneathiella chinensis]
MLPMSIGEAYDYEVPDHLGVTMGQFVKVPFGPREVTGVVWGEAVNSKVAANRIKAVQECLPVSPLPAESREFVDWVSHYTMQRPGRVLRMCMNVPEALYPKAPRTGYRRTGAAVDKMTPARRRVLEVLEGRVARTTAEISDIAGVSSSVIKGLADKGVLEPVSLPAEETIPVPDAEHPGFDLSDAQQNAADIFRARVQADDFSALLLEGVTGSGKTEVYFEAIAECLRQGRQALVLLPEIALSSQWLSRFEARFGVKPVEWHSDLGQGNRRRNWRAVIEGEAKVVVGARSALFLPFASLGLVVVDEEHEASFKQDEGVPYNARDMAVVRARIGKFPVILASATPSLETLTNAEMGRYQHIRLASRFGVAVLPAVELVDLKEHRPGAQRWISEPLRLAVEETLKSGQQAMLFLNRRGYAPLTLCDTCGHRLQCPHCSAWLVEHRMLRKLQCHHCGFSSPLPKECPECQDEDSFKACGPGIERLAEEAELLFPDANIAMIASDTLSGPKAAAEFVEAMTEGQINLLIGTQIVAKGYHFPALTLVGVVDADLGLAGGDLRASERTYQLLSQVAGRAGRAEHPGKVILQSYIPEHPVMEALVQQDAAAFFNSERQSRESAAMPPFGRLAALVLSSPDPESVFSFAKNLSRIAPHGDQFLIMGPAPAPLSMIRGRHRYRFLVKTAKNVQIQKLIGQWLKGIKVPSNVRMQIDIDPYNFM